MRPNGIPLTRGRRAATLALIAIAILSGSSLVGCSQQPARTPQQQYAYWTCRQFNSAQRMNVAFMRHDFPGTTMAARDVAGAATAVVDALTRPGWPSSVQKEVAILGRGEAAVALTFQALGAAQSEPELLRVPPAPHDVLVRVTEADRVLHIRLALHNACAL